MTTPDRCPECGDALSQYLSEYATRYGHRVLCEDCQGNPPEDHGWGELGAPLVEGYDE